MTPEKCAKLAAKRWPRKVRVVSTGRTELLLGVAAFGPEYAVVTDGGGTILRPVEDIERRWRRNH